MVNTYNHTDSVNNKNTYVIKTEKSTTYTFSCYILFIYGYKVTVNCKFIKRDARRDSDSYGKCGMRKVEVAII